MTLGLAESGPRSMAENMAQQAESPSAFEVEVTTRGELPGAAEYARDKIGALGRLTDQPVLFAHVKFTKHANPARESPVLAQANIDVNGRLVRAQVQAPTASEAVDQLETRLQRRLERITRQWETQRRVETSSSDWRRQSEPTQRPDYFPRPPEERRIIRRKSFTLATSTVDEAALEMDLLDYDFHLFVEEGTAQDSVLYRDGPTGYRLAQVHPVPADQLADFELPLTISDHPPPRRTAEQAAKRMGLLGLPFLFFVDVESNRGKVLYRRYDGHYGLITPAE